MAALEEAGVQEIGDDARIVQRRAFGAIFGGVERSALVASWGDFTADPLPLTEVAKARPEALKIMETIDFDG